MQTIREGRTVIDLDERRPHVVLPGLSAVHVVPLSLLRRMATGEIKVSEVDDFDDFIPLIIREWLEMKQEGII